jgi:long-chain acyl-CoA synthetase
MELSDSGLGAFFRAAIDIPEIPFGEMLWESAQRFPEKIAVIYQGQKISFRELDGLVNSFANALSRLGVKKGDRVALFMTNRPEYIITVYATARLGAVFTPMNPTYKEEEVAHQLQDSEASVLVVQDSLYPRVKTIRQRVNKSLKHVVVIGQRAEDGDPLFLDLIRQSPPKHPPQVQVSWTEDLVALPYSSGTTGLPKGAMLTHQNLVANAVQFISSGRITEQDSMLICLPFYHIYGVMLVNGALYSGATQVIMEAFDLELSLSLAQQHKVSLYYAVPPILLALADYPNLSAYDLSQLRYIMVGAAPMAPEVARRLQKRANVRIVQGYGLTEASPVTHLNPVDQGQVKLDSVGLSVANQEQKVVDLETGEREMEPGELGELIVKGPQVMQGYWKAPEETARAIRDGWLYTGDIARIDADGYVYIVDRKKEMIKYKGFSVAPAEVEAVLFQHEAVADCAVIGKPDTESGEIPKALVLLHPGLRIEAETLMEFVGGRLAGYKRVREVEFVTTIPKTASGKVLRRVLIEAEREKAKAQSAAAAAAAARATAATAMVEAAASDTAPVESVGSDETPANEMTSGEMADAVDAAPMPERGAMASEGAGTETELSSDEPVADPYAGDSEAFSDGTSASAAPGEEETTSSAAEADVAQEASSLSGSDDGVAAADGVETGEDRPSDETDDAKASAPTELAETSPETAPSEPAAS